jgi:hypothetical protein
MWKCADQELERQIRCFPYVELSDVPLLMDAENCWYFKEWLDLV